MTLDYSLLDSLTADQLIWLPDRGIGWYPVREAPYGLAYWERYLQMDQPSIGARLTEMRIDLVECFYNGGVVDVGIGGGRFVTEKRGARGYDVNRYAEAWLRETGRWADPYAEPAGALCFWDSLEHIHNPSQLLQSVQSYVFVSCPVFRDAAHVMGSKHYRRDEHCWYFTREGIRDFMGRFGLEQCHANSMEQSAGREDIETFVFRRAAA